MGFPCQSSMKDYKPSIYQQAIYDYIEHQSGHLVVEAAAGSGKTFTLMHCIDLIPNNKNICLTAFNRDIVAELTLKTSSHKNVDVRTLHSLGFLFIKRNFPKEKIMIDEFKYDVYLKDNIHNISSYNINTLSKLERAAYYKNIKAYINFGRLYLYQTVNDLKNIDIRYGITPFYDEKEIAIHAMEWGKKHVNTIDYTDMIWLPNVLYLKPLGLLYDYIMVDECQDMNRAERQLLLKCFKMGTRMISVGDSQQMLYSFAGGDPESFQALKSMPNTICLPLSISYRCAQNIVRYAQKIVPTIECNNDGRVGEIKHKIKLDDIKNGDMVLCRNNAPLIQIYTLFLNNGQKAFIRGKEIGQNLLHMIQDCDAMDLNVDCNQNGLFANLYRYIFEQRDKIMSLNGLDKVTAMQTASIQALIDSVTCLKILSNNLTTTQELKDKINECFVDNESTDGIELSTVHKAKGLEADNVYIACSYLMPSKSAKKDWEIRQENNLMYVAYTRARNVLGFIDDEYFKNISINQDLNLIESKVNRIFGKHQGITSIEDAKNVVQASEILDMQNLKKSITSNKKKKKANVFLSKLSN